jgi:hypothetical protein
MKIRVGVGRARISIRGYTVTKLQVGYTFSRPLVGRLISSTKPPAR